MSQMRNVQFSTNLPTFLFLHRATKLFCLLAALAVTLATPLFGQEDAYLKAFDLVRQGDSLEAAGKKDAAVEKYQQAQVALRDFQRNYPNTAKSAVAFRMNYVAQKISSLTKPAGATESVQAPTTGKTTPTKSAAASSTSPIKLINAGAEPRKLLRLHPKPGDKQSVTMTVKMAMTTKMGDTPIPQIKLPAMNFVMDSSVKDVSAEGDVSYDLEISEATVTDDPEVMQAAADAMKASLAQIKGMGASGVVSSAGVMKSLEFKAPSASDPQAGQTVDQMKEAFTRIMAPLPDDAVGVGAKWEVRTPVKSQGLVIDQTATYEIVSIEGDRVTTKCTVAQRASNQKIQNAMMPGMNLDLVKMTGSGMGTVTGDLSQLLSPKATMNEHTDMTMGMAVAGKQQTITMQMDVNTSIQAK